MIAEGNRKESAGNPREACEHYRSAVDVAPGYAKAHLNLGIGLEAIGDGEGALKSYKAALVIDPKEAYANYNLGNLLYSRGKPDEAERLLRLALELMPEFPEAHVALSNVYDSQGSFAAAAKALETALEQRPDYAGAWLNYGLVLKKLQRLSEAESALRRAIGIDPGFPTAYQALGAVLRGQSRIEEALEAFGTARRLAPERFDAESDELFTLNFSDDISVDALFARHRAFGERMEGAYPPRFGPFRNPRDPGRRLRVGYVSGDFYRHPVALFATPLIERHNRSACEVYCYSTGATSDGVTRQIRALADAWRDVASMSNAELADAVNRDQIDILVDLSGHSGVSRLGVFAQQPAPVQVTWLGYANTTGLTRIQYRLCDGNTDPPGLTERSHTESLLRLPTSQWCYRPPIPVHCSENPPCKQNGFITFGSFNHVSKLSPSVRRLWGEILTRLPDSHLVIANVPEERVTESLLRDLESAGIAASRIAVVPHVALEEHFRWFNAVDIALDTTPYGGVTTTCDTLWMGVPVITLSGTRLASRSSASILSTVGLPGWIASTPGDYVRLAVEFARDVAGIAELRQTLRGKMRTSPLMDEPRFARDVEEAYRHMWRAWCDGVSN